MNCLICGQPAERHHIVFGRGCRWDDAWNYAPLCPRHHRGNGGVHHNRALDLRLKRELQKRLEHWLDKPVVRECPEWISEKVWRKLVKPLQWDAWDNGYRTEELVRRMMGGKSYV